jgi:DNA-binding PadR family transcriptional regulator
MGVGTDDGAPLTEATFFILLSLMPGPRHGYGIIKDVPALSEGRVALTTGTLYGALRRLLDLGWIERVEPGPGAAGGREQKHYVLTALGRRTLAAEIGRLEGLLGAARAQAAREGV